MVKPSPRDVTTEKTSDAGLSSTPLFEESNNYLFKDCGTLVHVYRSLSLLYRRYAGAEVEAENQP